MISTRARGYTKFPYARGKRNPYNKQSNPDGVVSCANAENFLMHDYILSRINKHTPFQEPATTYNEGATGTVRLRSAMSQIINENFAPYRNVKADNITFAGGVTALDEIVALTMCDVGDGILLARPAYGSFGNDLVQRTGVKLHFVDFGSRDPFLDGAATVYEEALLAANANGSNIKAILICNPHNPLGSCFSKDALDGLVDLAVKYNIHLVSDEIYGLSSYRELPDRPNFTSVLSLDWKLKGAEELVHVLYGFSKDFGCAGLRLGCLITFNDELNSAVWPICRFSAVSQFSDHLASELLEDQEFVRQYIAKSKAELKDAFERATRQLDRMGIPYYEHGTAGFFIWMDLRQWLPLSETDDDKWKAEELLSQRLNDAGVVMGRARTYHGSIPGWFRLIFTIQREDLEEFFARTSKVLGISYEA